MPSYDSVDIQFHAFLSSTVDGDEWSALCSGSFNPVPTEYEADGPQSQPDSFREEKIWTPTGNRTQILRSC